MSTGSSPSASGRRAPRSKPRCVFCEIVAGRAPVSRVLETRRLLVLVPLHPKCDGHCLVVPKAHATRMHDLPDATLREAAVTLKRLASAMDLTSYNVLQNNGPHSNDPGVRPRQAVADHVHFHLIPRARGDRIRITARSSSAPTREELDRMAARIRDRFERREPPTP